MMRPVKLAGSQLIWGANSLSHLASLTGKKAVIVVGGGSMVKAGFVQKAQDYLKQAGIESAVFTGVEPDPCYSTCVRGAQFFLKEEPDWIIALGGGSVMDAAKTMWILYEHPEIKQFAEFCPPNKVPKLRKKAGLVAIPSTSGSASEVSRSICIKDDQTGLKTGVGDFEIMPDVAIIDPQIAATMPKKVTAETGMDALTHALEALVSNRVHFLATLLGTEAARLIFKYLPLAYEDGSNLKYREEMHNASMIAGMAFTNVSLGIVHSMAQTIGSYYNISHGVADAILLPYIIEFNSGNETAKEIYAKTAAVLGVEDLAQAVRDLNKKLDIPVCLSEVIPNEKDYLKNLSEMAKFSILDGCTKTNPIIPTTAQMEELLRLTYYGG